jgi:hypothetical protein
VKETKKKKKTLLSEGKFDFSIRKQPNSTNSSKAFTFQKHNFIPFHLNIFSSFLALEARQADI